SAKERRRPYGLTGTDARVLCQVTSQHGVMRCTRAATTHAALGEVVIEISRKLSWAYGQPGAEGQAQLPTVGHLRLYLRAWRDRYATELAELLAQKQALALTVPTVVSGALDSHPHLQLRLPPRRTSAQQRLREMLFTSFCAYSALLAAAVACLKVVSGLSLAPYVCANPRLTTPSTDPDA